MKSALSSAQLSTLHDPGTLVFPENLAILSASDMNRCQVTIEPSGHTVYWGPHGRRILATDPEGHPLHECAWRESQAGAVELVCARVQLDWGQWVGLRPSGMIHSTILDLTTQKNWQALRSDDLRTMAAQSIGVELSEVKFFYTDEDLSIGAEGQARIRHRKDALYVLENGTFDKARFMACMGAMHWARIDFLPVVELFQSLLPGTGSAIFELIHGLYHDQSGASPLPLRYRGVPTYPSEAAFRLFSGFFTPEVPKGEDPFRIFMDSARSQEVTWLSSRKVPRRYFDGGRSLCVTVKGQKIQKLTKMDDPSGISFLAPSRLGQSPCGKSVTVEKGKIVLCQGEERRLLDPMPSWGTVVDSEEQLERYPDETWQSFFKQGVPPIDAPSAFSAVLLYPEDEAVIDEASSHPFIGDYIEDLLSDHEQLIQHLQQAKNVYVSNFDGAIGSCLYVDQPREYEIVYRKQALAQKHAQRLWNRLAASKHLDWGKNYSFYEKTRHPAHRGPSVFDLIFYWTPFSLWDDEVSLEKEIQALVSLFHGRTFGFVIGSLALKGMLEKNGLTVLQGLPGDALPGFLMHRGLLPHAQLRAGLTLYLAVREQ